MAKEIERKFLMDLDKWKNAGIPVEMKQGYLCVEGDKVVRVRIAGDKAYITIKGNLDGITRDEFEYPIPVSDAKQMLKMCKGLPVSKTRWRLYFKGKTWEVDQFHEENEGLWVAEVELNRENEDIVLPDWVTEDVSTESKYFNFNLSVNPFSKW